MGQDFSVQEKVKPLTILPRRQQEQELWNIGRAWRPA